MTGIKRFVALLYFVAVMLGSAPAAGAVQTLSYNEDLFNFEWEFRFAGDERIDPANDLILQTPNFCTTDAIWCAEARFKQIGNGVRMFVNGTHERDPHLNALDRGGLVKFQVDDLFELDATDIDVVIGSKTTRHPDSQGPDLDRYRLLYNGGGGAERPIDFTLLGAHRAPVIPEPATLLLFGLGLLGVGLWHRLRFGMTRSIKREG
jgi:hypothetical protein